MLKIIDKILLQEERVRKAHISTVTQAFDM